MRLQRRLSRNTLTRISHSRRKAPARGLFLFNMIYPVIDCAHCMPGELIDLEDFFLEEDPVCQDEYWDELSKVPLDTQVLQVV